MEGAVSIGLILCCMLLLFERSIAHPLCIDSTAPLIPKTPLKFCSYDGSSCCNSNEDLQLERDFQAMNISDAGCASLVKSVICARCDQFSAELYTASSAVRSVPLLCNATVSAKSTPSDKTAKNFCSEVWDTCQNVSISNSPFAPTLVGQTKVPVVANVTKLIDLWQSETDFCNAFGGKSSESLVCFEGEPVALTSTQTPIPPRGLCLEKIGNGSYLNMVAHPDGSTRAFFSNQMGKIWLATLPDEGSGRVMELDESNPFLDLTDQVHFDTEFGMMGMAFHPNFTINGRFFASFNCDKVQWQGCNGRCSCNSDVNCDPSQLVPHSTSQPCQYQAVVAEYTANGTASQPPSGQSANPLEVRRIFTMGLPFTSHHAGQILFGPTDGYLYFMMGDGGGKGDPYNFSQNKKSLLGKIMRLDVDTSPSAAEIDKLGLWGNYSIPKDNPSKDDKELQPEIWAFGLRNPWRCSFDSDRPSYFVCADDGEDTYEEVDIITKGGNYGWRVFEGPNLFTPLTSSEGNNSLNSINPIPPVMGYYHSEVNKNEGSAAITGGSFYRSQTDPCMYGRYLYADLYSIAMWAGVETPENSGNFSTNRIPFSCARDSPIQCVSVPGSSSPSLGYIFSFGEDNRRDIYVLTSSGVYRVVRPSRCNYKCSKENVTALATTPGPSSHPSKDSSHGSRLNDSYQHYYVLQILYLGLVCVYVLSSMNG